jgi:hypothetical protein
VSSTKREKWPAPALSNEQMRRAVMSSIARRREPLRPLAA